MAKPVLAKQVYGITDIQHSYSGNVLDFASDSDAGDVVTVAGLNGKMVGPGPKQSETFAGLYGTLVIHQDGSYTYTLNDGLNLKNGDLVTETFQVKIVDTQLNYNVGKLIFNIAGTPNERPIAVADVFSMDSTTLTGNLLDNDSDPNHDILNLGIVNINGQQAHLVPKNAEETLVGVYGTLTVKLDGTFTYNVDLTDIDTINAGGVFTEKFAYKPHDGQNGEGNNTDYATVTINVDVHSMFTAI